MMVNQFNLIFVEKIVQYIAQFKFVIIIFDSVIKLEAGATLKILQIVL